MDTHTRIERRKERKPIDFEERRVEELLAAAERAFAAGKTATALLVFKNEIWQIQHPLKTHRDL